MGIRIPAFFGYYNAHRALLANQNALNVINNNIANVNTPGYSRQSINLVAASSYPPVSPSNLISGGFLGQGVEVQGINRTHDNYLDDQIRTQNSLFFYQSMVRDNLQQMEGILGGISSSGIHDAMKDFFLSAQALSIHADDMSSRASFMQSAQNMLDVFQQQVEQLQDLRTSLVGLPGDPSSFGVSQAAITVSQINEDIAQIANLNKQILGVSASGASPNDLLDQRDRILGELAEKINIEVEYTDDNQVNVQFGGDYLVRLKDVVNTFEAVENDGVTYGSTADEEPTIIYLSSDPATSVNSSITGGQLGGIIQMGGDGTDPFSIRHLMDQLNTLFGEMATAINAVQAAGRDLYGNIPAAPDDELFVGGGIPPDVFTYSVNSNIISDPRLIAAAIDDGTIAGGFAGVSDGRNALAMAAVQNTALAGLSNTDVNDFFNIQISRLGTDTKASIDTAANLQAVVQQLEQRRESIQGVNLEEEMINMLRFQRSFEASAKIMATLDKTLDLLINRMI